MAAKGRLAQREEQLDALDNYLHGAGHAERARMEARVQAKVRQDLLADQRAADDQRRLDAERDERRRACGAPGLEPPVTPEAQRAWEQVLRDAARRDQAPPAWGWAPATPRRGCRPTRRATRTIRRSSRRSRPRETGHRPPDAAAAPAEPAAGPGQRCGVWFRSLTGWA